MGSTIMVGIIFFGLIGWGIIKSVRSMRNNSCPGCSGACTVEKKSQCHGDCRH